jgi:hypothetical protein
VNVIFARPHKCLSKLVKGSIKRVPASGPLIGYYLRCPKCGARSVHLHDEVQFDEKEPWIQDTSDDGIQFQRPLSIAAKRPMPCIQCKIDWLLRDAALLPDPKNL